ncbi:uncharacterized protein MYCFIDRAFT_9243, partial [Pseudocercospora fijiensis CIRAD86]
LVVTDHTFDSAAYGAPYGTCEAYTGNARRDRLLDFYFWEEGYGKSAGEGAGCIKSPDDGTCGCENSDGEFIYGGDNC